MKLALVAGAVACALLAPRLATACRCHEDPDVVVTPPEGSRVPPAPTFYVFTPSRNGGREIRLSNTGTTTPHTMLHLTRIADDPQYVVWQATSEATDGVVELTVRYGGQSQTFRYVIAPEATASAVRPIELFVHEATDCGTTQEKAVSVTFDGNAIAYELEWDDGFKTVVPARDHMVGPRNMMRIGARCGTTNVHFDRLHEAHRFTLRALFADGSRTSIATSQLALGPTRVRPPLELLNARAAIDSNASPPLRTYVLHSTANPTGSSIAAGAATGGAIVLGGALLRARRRRRHAARL